MSSLKLYFDDMLKLNPSFAVFLGDKSKEHLSENSLSESYIKRADRMHEKYRASLKKENTSIDEQILSWIIKQYFAWKPYEYMLSPISSFENTIISFSFVNKSLYSKDPVKLLKRQKTFMSYIKSCQHRMLHPQHQHLPILIVERMISAIEKFIQSKAYIVDTSDASYVAFANGTYRRCLEGFVKFLKEQYLPRCREKVGMCHITKGREMYKLMISSYTTLDDTPDEIHAYGLKEVQRLTREMHRVKKLLGFPPGMSLKEFLIRMTDNHENSFASKREALNAYMNARKTVEKVLQDQFYDTVTPYEIRPVPKEMQQTSAGAFYMPGNGTRPGVFYVNMRDLSEIHKYSVLALSLHEGNPGHHYQFQYMIEHGVPLYRQYVYHNTAFIEGWALYAESLMDYSNKPYDKLGRLTYDMFRALRLVVDTGIHWKGWTYEHAVEYMLEHIAMTRSEIETEVQRYICMPAQALCYKIGEREILHMKQKYIRAFGKDAIKDFHKAVLEEGTSIPLRFLRQKIDGLITQAKSRRTGA